MTLVETVERVDSNVLDRSHIDGAPPDHIIQAYRAYLDTEQCSQFSKYYLEAIHYDFSKIK